MICDVAKIRSCDLIVMSTHGDGLGTRLYWQCSGACGALCALRGPHHVGVSGAPTVEREVLMQSLVEAMVLLALGGVLGIVVAVAASRGLANVLPLDMPIATLLTMVEVDPQDPAFQNPSKFVGPVYDEQEAQQLAAAKG